MTEAGSINARTRWRTLLAAEFNSDIRANSSLAPFSTVFERVPSRDSGNLTGGIRDEINYLIPVSISLVNNTTRLVEFHHYFSKYLFSVCFSRRHSRYTQRYRPQRFDLSRTR